MKDNMELKKNNQPSGYSVVSRSKNVRRILSSLTQPLTATQLSQKARMPKGSCCDCLRRLKGQGYVECLNPRAEMCRIYWLTVEGRILQESFFHSRNVELRKQDFPAVDWKLYGQMCTSHRRIVILTLTEPMQPGRIKRKAYRNDNKIRMSSSNARDTVRHLRNHGVVRKVHVRRRAHPLYELTELGIKFQSLLRSAMLPS